MVAEIYAKGTKVTVAKSRSDIESLLEKHRARSMAFFSEPDAAAVAFEMAERRVLFRIKLPKPEQQRREKWRALFLTIKAKLVSVRSEIETFEDAFMAHVVMPDGSTVSEHVTPRIGVAYKSGQMQPLLPPPEKK